MVLYSILQKTHKLTIESKQTKDKKYDRLFLVFFFQSQFPFKQEYTSMSHSITILFDHAMYNIL